MNCLKALCQLVYTWQTCFCGKTLLLCINFYFQAKLCHALFDNLFHCNKLLDKIKCRLCLWLKKALTPTHAVATSSFSPLSEAPLIPEALMNLLRRLHPTKMSWPFIRTLERCAHHSSTCTHFSSAKESVESYQAQPHMALPLSLNIFLYITGEQMVIALPDPSLRVRLI